MSAAVRRDVLRSLALLALLEFLLWAAIWYWPEFQNALDESPTIVRGLAALPFLRDAVDRIAEHGAAPYVAGQHFFKGCNTLGVAAAVLFAVSAVAGEAHRGTLELLLSRPVSRTRLLLERHASGLVGVLAPVLLSTLSVNPILAYRTGDTIPDGPLLLCAVHECCLLLAVYGVAFLCSAVGRHPLRLALGLLFFFSAHFALYIVKDLNAWSLFRFGDIDRMIAIFETGRLDLRICGAAVGIWAACLWASTLAFGRRLP